MAPKNFTPALLMLFLAGLVSACGPDQANRSMPAESRSLVAKPDNVSAQELSAGIEAMTSRILRTEDAFSKVEPTSTFRYFMHPTIQKDALIEFDVSGLSSVTLSPRIGPLDANCLQDPKAGEVEMAYTLDDATQARFTVDRNHDELIIVRVGETKRLTVTVNQGNDVVTCDWFGLGISHVSENATE